MVAERHIALTGIAYFVLTRIQMFENGRAPSREMAHRVLELVVPELETI
jgi:hypothetical protein